MMLRLYTLSTNIFTWYTVAIPVQFVKSASTQIKLSFNTIVHLAIIAEGGGVFAAGCGAAGASTSAQVSSDNKNGLLRLLSVKTGR